MKRQVAIVAMLCILLTGIFSVSTVAGKMEVRGDINGDGICNMKDAILLYSLVSGDNTFGEGKHGETDLNNDGFTNGKDMLLLYRVVSGVAMWGQSAQIYEVAYVKLPDVSINRFSECTKLTSLTEWDAYLLEIGCEPRDIRTNVSYDDVFFGLYDLVVLTPNDETGAFYVRNITTEDESINVTIDRMSCGNQKVVGVTQILITLDKGQASKTIQTTYGEAQGKEVPTEDIAHYEHNFPICTFKNYEVRVCESRSDLDEFIEEHRVGGILPNGLQEAVSTYNESFFEEKVLIVTDHHENSVSNYQEITACTVTDDVVCFEVAYQKADGAIAEEECIHTFTTLDKHEYSGQNVVFCYYNDK